MSSDQPKPPPPGIASRQERQAAALRENLRRRKEQARERGQSEPAPPAGDTADPSDSGGDA